MKSEVELRVSNINSNNINNSNASFGNGNLVNNKTNNHEINNGAINNTSENSGVYNNTNNLVLFQRKSGAVHDLSQVLVEDCQKVNKFYEI